MTEHSTSSGQAEPTTRRSGVLLHVTSLPSRYGIGDLGPDAHALIAALDSAEQSYWQMLPVVPTGYGDSPYQSPSAFAGNTMLISPDRLIELGLVSPDDTDPLRALPHGTVDYQAVIRDKTTVLAKAAAAFSERATPEQRERFLEFGARVGPEWLDDAALFTAIKDSLGKVAWNTWPVGLALRDPDELRAAQKGLSEEVETYRILQFLFFEQWQALRDLAETRRIKLVGDVPLYVAHDSADVWANPDNYLLDSDRQPTVVAGVPPDYFSATGQRWGNPIYDWEAMRDNGFRWWRSRMAHVLSMFEVVRVDHFRGISGYWAIPADEETAIAGEWREGPGGALLDSIGIGPGHPGIIAEDLGLITDDVIALRDGYELPGMRVAQFGFDDAPDTPLHHPDAFIPEVWAYTGTHDNNTTEGWFWEGNPGHDVDSLDPGRKRLYDTVGQPISRGLVEMVAHSKAGTTMFPAQDLLGLGAEMRMNTPGTTENNWRWRLRPGELTEDILEHLTGVTRSSGRVRSSTQ